MDAVAAAIAGRISSGTWTLADVAPAAGMTPAGLVKRFGSRAGLVSAMWERWLESIPVDVVGNEPAEAELRQYLRGAFSANSSQAARVSLVALLDDLSTPESAALLHKGWSLQAHYVARLLQEMGVAQGSTENASAHALLDSLLGRIIRSAAQGTARAITPDETLDYFLEVWT